MRAKLEKWVGKIGLIVIEVALFSAAFTLLNLIPEKALAIFLGWAGGMIYGGIFVLVKVGKHIRG